MEKNKQKYISFIIVVLVIILGAFLLFKSKATSPALTYDEYLQEGINFETKGDLKSAIASYEKASEVAPTDYVPYSNIGSAYYAEGEYGKAETAFLKALELGKNNVSVYTKLYEVYFKGLKRNLGEMNAFFIDAMTNTNNDINIVRLYASYLEEINELKLALPIWEGLLKVEPDNAAYKAKIEALKKKINQISN